MLGKLALGFALALATVGPVHAGQTIEADKMTKAELRQAIEAAPDDAVIEFQGQKKTKAALRSDWLAAHKPPDATEVKARIAAMRAKEAADAKAVVEDEALRIAAENARVDAEFETLKAR
jgi:hypothetical protein